MPPVTAEPASREFHIIAGLLIIFLTVLAYFNSFYGVFDFDDVRHITENSFIRITDLSWSSISPVINEGPSHQRWVPMVSLALNYFFGAYDVFGYHVVNLALHLLTALLLYYFFNLVLVHAKVDLPGRRLAEISLVAVLLWSLHPLQTNVVTYIVQRMTSFAALFYIAVCICYIKGRLDVRPAYRWAWWVGGLVLWGLALSSKENSAILPLVLLLYDYYFLRQPEESGKIHLIALLLAGVLGAVLAVKFLGTNPLASVQAGYSKYPFTMGERLLTESRVVFYYLGLLLLPLPSRLNLCYDYPISHSLLAPLSTLIAMVGITGLVGLTVFLYRRDRLWSFAIFWFLVNLVIESSIFPIELIYEHRLYLPSTLLFLAVTTLVYRLAGKNRMAVRAGVAVVCLLLAIGTWQRNQVWVSVENLWMDVVDKSPGITRGYTNLGRFYNRQQRFDKSMEVLRKGLEIDPRAGLIWLNIGYVYAITNKHDLALSAYRKALEDSRMQDVDGYKAHAGMSFVYLSKGQPEMALAKAEDSLRLNPNFANAWLFKGMSLGLLGQHDKALESGRKAVSLAPQLLDAYLLVSRALDNMGRTSEALAVLDQGVAASGDNPESVAPLRDYLSKKLATVGGQ